MNVHSRIAGDMLLTEKDAAARLGISSSTIRRRVADGTVPPPVKLGALTRYKLSDILRYIDSLGEHQAA